MKNTSCPKKGKKRPNVGASAVPEVSGEWSEGRCIYRHDDKCMHSSSPKTGLKICVDHPTEPK